MFHVEHFLANLSTCVYLLPSTAKQSPCTERRSLPCFKLAQLLHVEHFSLTCRCAEGAPAWTASPRKARSGLLLRFAS